MFTRERIFTVYEKPEAAEPAERMVLLREGFSWGALLLGGVWILMARQWVLLGLYVIAAIVLSVLAEGLHLSEISSGLLQFWLQLMLALHWRDLQGWRLTQRGYRLAGVLAAESTMLAERRYHECAA